MGHKVNPFSWRLINNKNWQSKWFGKGDFAKNIREDLAIREAVRKKYDKNASIRTVEISRDHEAITVNLYTSKPGVLIGRSGQGVVDLRRFILKSVPDFRTIPLNKQPKINIEILEVKNPEVQAKLVAENIASQIERRIMYKRAIKQAIAKASEAKAKGIKIQISGRLNGAEIARSEKYGTSSVPLGRLRAEIDYGFAEALTTYGTIGIKVWIYKGDKIYDEEFDNSNQKKEKGR